MSWSYSQRPEKLWNSLCMSTRVWFVDEHAGTKAEVCEKRLVQLYGKSQHPKPLSWGGNTSDIFHLSVFSMHACTHGVNSHFPGKPGLPSCFFHLFLTCASCQDRTKLFFILLSISHQVFQSTCTIYCVFLTHLSVTFCEFHARHRRIYSAHPFHIYVW